MNSIVESASLLLTSIAFLYSAWSGVLNEVRNYDLAGHYLDLKTKHIHLKEVFRGRLIPILFGSFLSTIIFIPKVIDIIKASIKLNIEVGIFQALKYYDIPSAVLFVVEFFLFLLMGHLFRIALELKKKIVFLNNAQDKYKRSKNIPSE